MRAFLFIISILLVCGKISGQGGELNDFTLGVWLTNNNADERNESEALLKFLETLKFSKLNVLTDEDLVRQSKLFRETDIIWIYKNDTLPVKSADSKKIFSNLSGFVRKGGKLVLANQALAMISCLGLEDVKPETRIKPTIDEGYGRQLGYHAFRWHPLFDGMNGGAYVIKPLNDTTVLQTGYFGDKKPLNGKVIGVDWDYIFLREESKLIIEYESGKGKVLGIGGYLLFSVPNRNRIHLETFTKNIFRYLGGFLPDSKCLYWNYDSSVVIETPFKLGQPVPHTGSTKFPELESELNIKPGKSTGNYWDLAGERLLLMGEDQGGIREIWAHPALCLRDYEVNYSLAGSFDTMVSLSKMNPEIEILPASYIRKYDLTGDLTGDLLGEAITVSSREPFAVIHYDYKGNKQLKLEITFRALFRLMWPYSEKVLGNLYYSWNDDLQAFIMMDQSGDFVTIVGVNGKRDGVSCIYEMPSQLLSFELNLPGPGSFDILIASSSEGFEKTLSSYLKALADPPAVFFESQAHADSILQKSLMFDSRDSNFNAGYRWALLATDRFQVNTPGIGSSLVAGYATSDKGWDGGHAVSGRPGYGWYFGRDGAWSGFALLHYGDFEKVRLMLETFQHYQDLNGKIFHELSTSGIVHYDAADATPLYIILAGRYLRHSGDSAFIRASWPYIKKALDFCYSTDTDGDLLIENTNVGHGWEEGGHLFGSHTTLYLASCWAAALDEASYLAKNLGLVVEETKYHKDAITVKTAINSNFWNQKNNFYYHGLMPDGTYLEDMSIMPCIPMLFSQADRDKSQKVLPVIATSGFTSDWGCRIVEEGSPHFNPGGYHTGSVWPLFTGWAALAEFRNNNYLQGYSHLMSNMLLYKYWGLGFIEEVLHGETFEPFGVCHHQCWSETMALQPAIEGMLGYQPDALNHKLTLKPWFPADWDSVKVTGIRLGNEEISMEAGRHGGMEAGKQGFVNTFIFDKSGTDRLDVHFQPVFPPGSTIKKIRVNGLPAKDPGFRVTEQGWGFADFGFWLDSIATVEIYWEGGITALPVIYHPGPGDRSEGMRIINTSYSDKEYSITVEGLPSKQYELKVWAADPDEYKADGAEIKDVTRNTIILSVIFPDTGTKYAVNTILLFRK
jgi:glycogen debranching enzyme